MRDEQLTTEMLNFCWNCERCRSTRAQQREPVWSHGAGTRERGEQVAQHYITAVAICDCSVGIRDFVKEQHLRSVEQ